MARSSPFRIQLTPPERETLELTARRYTLPHREVVRAKIVLYAADGLSNQEIADRLDTPREVVSKWRKRFYDKRLDGMEDGPRSGRPARFSPLRGGRG